MRPGHQSNLRIQVSRRGRGIIILAIFRIIVAARARLLAITFGFLSPTYSTRSSRTPSFFLVWLPVRVFILFWLPFRIFWSGVDSRIRRASTRDVDRSGAYQLGAGNLH